MGLFNSSNSWTAQAKANSPPGNKGQSWSQVQAKQAKERKKEIVEANKRKKQARRDLARRNRNPLRRTPGWTQVAKGADKKTLKKAQEKRDKKQLEKDIRKAERKAKRRAKGFWG
jgi:hypothetical protein